MKTTVDLPESMVREVKLRAAHEGKKLKDVYVELIGQSLATDVNGSNNEQAKWDARRREMIRKVLSGEWSAELPDYEESRKIDRMKAERLERAWRD